MIQLVNGYQLVCDACEETYPNLWDLPRQVTESRDVGQFWVWSGSCHFHQACARWVVQAPAGNFTANIVEAVQRALQGSVT